MRKGLSSFIWVLTVLALLGLFLVTPCHAGYEGDNPIVRAFYRGEGGRYIQYLIPVYDWMPKDEVVFTVGALKRDSPPSSKCPEPAPVTTEQEPEGDVAEFSVQSSQEERTETPPPIVRDEVELTSDEKIMLDLLNRERAKKDLALLKIDSELVRLARLKSQDMVDECYFAHKSPTYGSAFDMMDGAGVPYKYAAENIAGTSTVERAHELLMNSETHKVNILNPNYTRVGVGIAEGGPYRMMFTQMFIGR